MHECMYITYVYFSNEFFYCVWSFIYLSSNVWFLMKHEITVFDESPGVFINTIMFIVFHLHTVLAMISTKILTH